MGRLLFIRSTKSILIQLSLTGILCFASVSNVSLNMLKKAVVDEKSIRVGGTGINSELAARMTDNEIVPRAGGDPL